jgi:nitrile hydratase subunit beta
MNGVHDMGGMHGFGPIAPEADEPVFHEIWEARMFGLSCAMTSPPGFTIDRSRYLRETMPPVAYLTWSYYEHWYFATAQSLLEAGIVTMEELRTGRAAAGRPKRNDAMRPADVDRISKAEGRYTRTIDTPPHFSAGRDRAKHESDGPYEAASLRPRQAWPGSSLARRSRFRGFERAWRRRMSAASLHRYVHGA